MAPSSTAHRARTSPPGPSCPGLAAGLLPTARHEAEPHAATGIVGVGVHEHHALPRAERRSTLEDRDHQGRRHEGGDHVIGAVAPGAVAVAVAVVTRQQPLEGVDEVGLGPRSGLHQGHPGGGVRDEDRAQPVAAARAERLDVVGQVDDLTPRRVDGDDELSMEGAVLRRRCGDGHARTGPTAPRELRTGPAVPLRPP